jgi:prepilin-type N-terminal cleavage/methylation domain-containing protein
MWNRTPEGFSLLEVLVALGLLAVSTLVIAEALGASIEYARAADLARRATAAAATVADTASDRVVYPSGWRVVGAPGADGLPGTADDGLPEEPGPACRRRVSTTPDAGSTWVWIEVTCWPEAGPEGPDGGATTSPGSRPTTIVLTRVLR